MDRRTLLIAGAASMTTPTPLNAAPLRQDTNVAVSGVEIACRLCVPPAPLRGAVLILPGSLYSDADGDFPAMNLKPHAYRDLAEQLAAQGLASLRMAKIGPGTGSRVTEPVAARRHGAFHTRVDVAAEGLNVLRRAAPACPMVVAGHSEGAVVASLLAAAPAGERLDGVVSLSGPALPILSILRLQVAAMSPPGVPADMTLFDRTLAAIRAGEPLPEEAKSDMRTGMLAAMPPEALAYLRSVDEVEPVAALARVRQPVLIVQGGRDDSVPPSHAELLRAGRAVGARTEVAMFPGLTHFYKVVPPDLTPMQSMGLDTESDPGVAAAIATWAAALTKTA